MKLVENRTRTKVNAGLNSNADNNFSVWITASDEAEIMRYQQ